jgi:hypothetical protein
LISSADNLPSGLGIHAPVEVGVITRVRALHIFPKSLVSFQDAAHGWRLVAFAPIYRVGAALIGAGRRHFAFHDLEVPTRLRSCSGVRKAKTPSRQCPDCASARGLPPPEAAARTANSRRRVTCEETPLVMQRPLYPGATGEGLRGNAAVAIGRTIAASVRWTGTQRIGPARHAQTSLTDG